MKDFWNNMPPIIITKVQFLQSICSWVCPCPFRHNKEIVVTFKNIRPAWFPLGLNNCIAQTRAERFLRLLLLNLSPETPASFRSVLIRPQCDVSVYKRCFISWCGGSKNRLQTSLEPTRGRSWEKWADVSQSTTLRRSLTLSAGEKLWIMVWWNWDGAGRADLSQLPASC